MITRLVSIKGFGGEDDMSELASLPAAAEERVRELTQVGLKVTHRFAPGLYYREMLIPKGTTLTGRVHKKDDLKIVYYGDIEVMTEDGYMRVQGPAVLRGRAGSKPWALALEDTLWASVTATELTDLDEIEKELFEDEPSSFDFKTGMLKGEVTPCLPQP